MRVCQFLCVGLALILSSCASWHRPDLVFRGKQSARSETAVARTEPIDPFAEEAIERPNQPQMFDEASPTLTPPVQSVSHRTGFRGDLEQARPVRNERLAPNPPGPGYIELPPPPDSN